MSTVQWGNNRLLKKTIIIPYYVRLNPRVNFVLDIIAIIIDFQLIFDRNINRFYLHSYRYRFFVLSTLWMGFSIYLNCTSHVEDSWVHVCQITELQGNMKLKPQSLHRECPLCYAIQLCIEWKWNGLLLETPTPL